MTDQKLWGDPEEPDKPWEAPDGTRWLYFPIFEEWDGWEPQEGRQPVLVIRTIGEFRVAYPEAPRWDGWRG